MNKTSPNKGGYLRLFIVLAIALIFIFGLTTDSLARAPQAPEAVDSVCYEIWTAVINVADNGGVSEPLTYGQGLHANDGLDENCGESRLPPKPPAGSFDARLILPVGTDASKLDLRPADQSGTIEWRIEFQPGPGGYPFTFTWDTAALPGAGTIRLQDVFGGAIGVDIDMRGQSSYELQDTDIEKLDIVYTTDRCTITAVANGDWSSDATWNENCQAGTPSTTDDVYVPGSISVNFNPGAATAESLTVGGAGMLVFTNDGTLTVSDNAFARDNGMIDLSTAGVLAVSGELTNEGRLRQTKTVDATESTEATVTFLDIAGYGGLTITSNATSLGSTTVTIKGGQACDTDDTAVHRCFYVTPTNSTTVADLVLNYGSGEVNGSTCSTMQAWRSLGGNSWTEAGTAETRTCSSDPYSVSYSGVTIQNTQSIYDLRSDEAPTAISLNYFSAQEDNTTPLLPFLGLAALIILAAILIWRFVSRRAQA